MWDVRFKDILMLAEKYVYQMNIFHQIFQIFYFSQKLCEWHKYWISQSFDVLFCSLRYFNITLALWHIGQSFWKKSCCFRRMFLYQYLFMAESTPLASFFLYKDNLLFQMPQTRDNVFTPFHMSQYLSLSLMVFLERSGLFMTPNHPNRPLKIVTTHPITLTLFGYMLIYYKSEAAN